ncbi:hypothetical protein BOSEA31B_11130 [Hyphomicrobiales bacterium]|nr:hypothetical protein BOSEA31B_11130 [Hyphomicrobiales bacterium]CAH1700982.1 hypothetical protein BOSEA1005_20681 [Hyphomicrobiales bacterium]CAI0344860.1 hypothetical protein BO1005MUT1_350227 [Hyphomicrobiales bacterium]
MGSVTSDLDMAAGLTRTNMYT